MARNKVSFMVVIVFFGFGFLAGLTGIVAAVPGYSPDSERQPDLVYNKGLGPSGQIAVEEPGGDPLLPEDLALLGKGVFSSKGCVQCHSISSLDVVAGVYGPDLSNAITNVPNKYAKTLLEFLREPEGVMGTVLPGKNVSDRDKEGIAEYLEGAATP
ncbi:MAG: cytochrome C [Peptococcaceae bacterium]|nr:cytochrome C [Peptococcaceae bacterium]